MATHKSALKAHRASLRRRAANRSDRTRLRTQIRQLRKAAASGEATAAEKMLPATVSLVDRSVRKGVLHVNAGARHKSRLSRLVRAVARSESKSPS
jgi:small subunit ribosomal protein S20